jgi:hypothetical protein
VYRKERSRGHKRTFGRSRISRARFLRMIGTGAGLSLLPSSVAALGAKPVGAQAAGSELEILTSPDFPIGAWWPPPPVNTGNRAADLEETGRRYAQVADANFNFVVGGNGVSNDRANGLALEAIDANNLGPGNDLRLVLDDFKLQNLLNGKTSPSAQSEETEPPSVMQEVIEEASPDTVSATGTGSLEDQIRQQIQHLHDRFATFPSLGGIHLYDEPHKRLFGRLAFAKNEVLGQFAREELPYINVWPSHASPSKALGAKTYADYLRAYRAQVAPPLLCFDHYPLLSKGITPDYYYNCSVIRKYSLQEPAIPAWGIIQSLGFDATNIGLARRRSPTEAEILWQVNVGLAYGAKGIIYFTYWTPDSSRETKFNPALIGPGPNGVPTERYEYAKRVNAYLRVIGGVLKPLVSESVVHAGVKRLPRGAAAFKPDGFVRSVSGSPVIIGKFYRSSPADTERHLLVVNRSLAKAASTVLSLSDAVTEIREYDAETGTLGEPSGSTRLDLRMAAGTARLFVLQKA